MLLKNYMKKEKKSVYLYFKMFFKLKVEVFYILKEI